MHVGRVTPRRRITQGNLKSQVRRGSGGDPVSGRLPGESIRVIPSARVRWVISGAHRTPYLLEEVVVGAGAGVDRSTGGGGGGGGVGGGGYVGPGSASPHPHLLSTLPVIPTGPGSVLDTTRGTNLEDTNASCPSWLGCGALSWAERWAGTGTGAWARADVGLPLDSLHFAQGY